MFLDGQRSIGFKVLNDVRSLEEAKSFTALVTGALGRETDGAPMEPTSDQVPQAMQARPENSVLGSEPALEQQQHEQPQQPIAAEGASGHQATASSSWPRE